MEVKKFTYSVDEVAMMLSISRNLCYRLAREKKIAGCIHLGTKRMVFSAQAIDGLLSSGNNNIMN
jgi:excisionase family DNA binding protein